MRLRCVRVRGARLIKDTWSCFIKSFGNDGVKTFIKEFIYLFILSRTATEKLISCFKYLKIHGITERQKEPKLGRVRGRNVSALALQSRAAKLWMMTASWQSPRTMMRGLYQPQTGRQRRLEIGSYCVMITAKWKKLNK